MPGFASDTVGGGGTLYATNVDFTGNSFTTGSPQMVSDGQLLIGSAVNPRIRVGTLGSSDSSITWTVGHGTITGQVTGGSTVGKTITGNSGGPLAPNLGNWNILGAGSITTSGSLSTLTTQLTGLTNHAVQVGAGTATLTQLAVGTNGQVLIGSTAADPVFGTLTSSDSSISFTTGAGTLSLQVSGGSTVIKTITGNSGGAEVPSAGNFNILGTGSITVAGSANTETVQLTGLTNHAVLVGAGTATITNVSPSATSGVPLISQGAAADPTFGTTLVAGGGTGATTLTGILTGNGTSAFTASTVTQHGVLVGGASNAVSSTAVGSTGQVLQANTGADPTYSTATYPSTTTINQILYSSSANTVAGLATVNSASLATSSTGVPTWLGPMTNGQLVIGSTSATPVATTLTAGAGIAITNGAGSITIASSGGGFTWSDTSGTVTAVAANGYFITGTTTSTLPASPNEGDTIKYIVDTTNILTITAAGTQLIRIGTKLSAAGGTAANTQRGDAVELVYRTVGTTWIAQDANGGWNVT